MAYVAYAPAGAAIVGGRRESKHAGENRGGFPELNPRVRRRERGIGHRPARAVMAVTVTGPA